MVLLQAAIPRQVVLRRQSVCSETETIAVPSQFGDDYSLVVMTQCYDETVWQLHCMWSLTPLV
jgi:hypothetical protein